MKVMVSKHFDLRELVPPEVWEVYERDSRWFIDERLIDALEAIRKHFGRIVTVNNWHLGGNRKYSGFRHPACNVGAQYSQHRYGRAADIVVSGISAEEVRNVIRKRWQQFGVTCIESNTPTWTHIDIRWTNKRTLLEVAYKV